MMVGPLDKAVVDGDDPRAGFSPVRIVAQPVTAALSDWSRFKMGWTTLKPSGRL